DATNTAIETTSSGSPGRSISTPSSSAARATGFSMNAAVPGVAMKPGLRLTARIPTGAPSTASWRVKETTAPLAAELAEIPATLDPPHAAVEDTLMITPFCSARWFHAYLVV